MKVLRYRKDATESFGELVGDRVLSMTGSIATGLARDDKQPPLDIAELELLAPTVPSKIVAVGPNYKAHFVGRPIPSRPILWIKPPSTLAQPGGSILLPRDGEVPFNHESELAVVIGREARDLSPEQALDCVFGYTCINDVTGGNLADKAEFRSSEAFVDGKIFDTFAPLGPWIETDLDPRNLRIRCEVNGEVRQDHQSSDMIWPIEQLIARITRVMTLQPGDVIATGSPPGSTPLKPGDQVMVEVEGIGQLRNEVRAR